MIENLSGGNRAPARAGNGIVTPLADGHDDPWHHEIHHLVAAAATTHGMGRADSLPTIGAMIGHGAG
jgi:hypothetical protein